MKKTQMVHNLRYIDILYKRAKESEEKQECYLICDCKGKEHITKEKLIMFYEAGLNSPLKSDC